ncbi:hypothetical protein [Halorussus amylolyticus]|uniref:hypothetical protein n=1 Tax=Halorussus amylolyticus TaxID=1126242 RepID=UPI001046D63B|nr:hypothetical protein [Halorussus amylolyticus]
MIVADTSALVSLATVGLVPILCEEFDCHTTEAVAEELRATAEYDDVSGEAAQSVLDQFAQMTIHEVEASEFESSRIDRGEGRCAVLTHELDADFLVTDDLRALPELQTVAASKVAISPIVLEALVRRDVLTRDRAKSELRRIANRRDWLEAPIYRRAQALLD